MRLREGKWLAKAHTARFAAAQGKLKPSLYSLMTIYHMGQHLRMEPKPLPMCIPVQVGKRRPVSDGL